MARRHTRQQDRLTRPTMLAGAAAALGGAVVLDGGGGVAAHSYDLAGARRAIQDTADGTMITGVIERT